MKDTIRTATIALIAVFVLGVMLSISDTVKERGPIPQATAQIALDRRSQEAQVTATYIAVLSSEVVSDTMNTHSIMRQREREQANREDAVEKTVSTAKQWITGFSVIAFGMVSVGAGFWLGGRGIAAGVKHVKDATVPPSRRLPDGTNLVRLSSGQIRAIETRAGGKVWDIEDDTPSDEMAARDVREFQFAVVNALASAFVENGGVKLLTGGNNGNN